MIKFVYAWRDHPAHTAEECQQHYRQVHMPLARKAWEGVDGFVAIAYNRVLHHTINDYNRPEAIERDTDIDAFVELWFEDRERFEQAFGNPVLGQMFEDHGNFMDVDSPANIRVYEVEEDVFVGRRPT